MSLYNLNGADGEILALIQTNIPCTKLSNMWTAYWNSDERINTDNEDEAVDAFFAKLKVEDPRFEQLLIDNIFV